MLCTSGRHYPLLSTGVQPRKSHPNMTEKLLTGIKRINRTSVKSVTKIYFSYFSTKTYVVGTQKNRLNETVLLSTQNI